MDQEYDYLGKRYSRKKGEKVDARLMASWRALRKRQPGLFRQGVLVWGQRVGYEDEIICDFHSELLSRECRQVVHQVDMFAGELTEHMEEVNFKRQQAKHVIGMKQTFRCQLTDVGFAANGKKAGEVKKRELRRAQRVRAAREGVSAKLEASAFELLSVAVAMHADCVQRNAEEQKVLATFRACGWPAYDLGSEGLMPASEEKWKDFPLGSSRLGPPFLASRFSHVKDGVPERPNWNRLHDLIARQQQEADEKTKALQGRIATVKKRKFHAAFEIGALDVDRAAKAEEAQPLADAEAKVVVDLKGFTDFSMPERLFEDQVGAEPFSCSLMKLEELESGENAAFNLLRPSVRKQLLEEARSCLVTSQKPTDKGKAALRRVTLLIFP